MLFSHHVIAVTVLLCTLVSSAARSDSLGDGFVNPPSSARPLVWWHWMNGNVTKEGIEKDLDWMTRVGIGGVQSFDVNVSTPQIVDKRLMYMTPEWQDAFRFAVQLADQNGLEFAIASSPGWSETGGPWVKPEDGMKKLVWSEVTVTSGKRQPAKLPRPPKTTGSFQDLPLHDDLAGFRGGEIQAPEHYSDIAVLAYRVTKPVSNLPMPRMILLDGKLLDGAMLTDDRFVSGASIDPGTRDKPQIIAIEYAEPQTVRSATISIPGAVGSFWSAGLMPRLEVSKEEGHWRTVVEISLSTVPTTVSFAPITARKFRVVLQTAEALDPLNEMIPVPGADISAYVRTLGSAQRQELKIAELRLSSQARINQFETKAGFSVANDYYQLDANIEPDAPGVAPDDVMDVTAKMQPDGTLNWTPPQGVWRVVRLGWSLTGKTNHPATVETTGLEVDKMDANAVRRYLERYLAMYEDTVGASLVGSRGVRALLTDSTEVRAFNWTPRMIEQFQRLRGYDPTPWLPALTGTIIGSRRQSDAFLYDFRLTIGQLHASEHYGTIAEIAHQRGLQVYGEALEGGRDVLGDDMSLRRSADYPMAALWTYAAKHEPRTVYRADLKGASSVAHVYGQNVAAAESMTSMLAPWAHAPADLRRVIDFEFASGINRPVIHTSVHQPVDDKQPGLSLFIFGQYFNRHDSWAELARPWVDYIARNSFMLQQGRNVADVAYFYGEEAPLTGLYSQQPVADAPTRYAYDFVNRDALFDALSVENCDLAARSGARYKLLYLGGSSRRMTLATLRRIAQLVEAGATVVGAAPEASPSLKDDPIAFASLVQRLWNGQSVTRVGKGRVIFGNDVEAALALIGVAPDFTYTKVADDSEVLFVHRKLDDGDAYFVNNRKNRAERIEARFRVSGKRPEMWRADFGTSEPLSHRTDGDTTIVPLEMAAEDSFFVVFREPTSTPSTQVARSPLAPIAQIEGPWSVTFQRDRGAPPSLRFEKLGSLSDHSDRGVRYFSGVATYATSFNMRQRTQLDRKLVLDLGAVGDIAEVRVNGELIGTAWHAPYRLDIDKVVKFGANTLEVRVANLWVNRLIGDAQPGAKKIAWTALPTYTEKAPLRASGLMGPVRLFVEETARE